MKYRIINRPVFVDRTVYLDNISKIADFLSGFSSVKSIYKLGSVSDPGISDVDLLVIFKKDKGLYDDPRQILDEKGKYLFIHQLFGIHEDLICDAMRYTMFQGFKHIYGEVDINLTSNTTTSPQISNQIAIEYLLKMYISLSIQKEFRIIKLRSFLLEAKAVRFDLEVLGLSDTRLSNMVDEILMIRKQWFKKPLSDKKIELFFLEFINELRQTLNLISIDKSLYVSRIKPYKLSRNINLSNGDLYFKTSRFIPNLTTFIPYKYLINYYSLENRLVTFDARFPMKLLDNNSIMEKNNYEQEAIKNLSIYAPNFIALKSPIKLNP